MRPPFCMKDEYGSKQLQKNEMALYKSKLKKEMEQIYKKFQDQTSLLVREIKYLKSKVERESGFRADLIYQKGYLVSLLGGLSGW